MSTSNSKETASQPYRRAPQEPQKLTYEAQVWLLSLPAELRPLHLARAYARIVNRLTTLWTRPSGADQYLHSLVNDTRGGRRGFPQPIPEELRRLQAYYEAEVAPNILPAERPTTNMGSPTWQQNASTLPPGRGDRSDARLLTDVHQNGDLEQWIVDWLGSAAKRS